MGDLTDKDPAYTVTAYKDSAHKESVYKDTAYQDTAYQDTAYRETASAFDLIAADYDKVYGTEGNAMMTWMRQQNLAILINAFPTGSHLLELGCGSGDEAVALAVKGYKVLATDISPKMAMITRKKAVELQLGNLVKVVAVPAGHIGMLQPKNLFDGAYASFGSLNCESDLSKVAAGLASLLKPGTRFVISVMGSTCLFEIIWYLLHLRPCSAFRRFKRGWQLAPVAGQAGVEVLIPTRYLSARDIDRAFGEFFTIERVFALPLLLPPPYADRLYRRYRAIFKYLELWDLHLRAQWPWRYLGDHIQIVLRKNR